MIADLRARLEDREHPSDGTATGESHESHESAPLRGMSSEVGVGEEGESLHVMGSRRMVTFVDSGGHTGSPMIGPPSPRGSPITETTNETSCDSGAQRSASSVVSGDTPVSLCVANPDLTGAVGVESGSVGSGELIQHLSQLVQTQTAMVAAQTRAMSAQSLPPIPSYGGEGEQSLEDGFERWIEQFEERARLAGWSEDLRRYHLKMRLSKTAFQTYRLLPDNVKASYGATVSALRSKFKPVDIEELRGMEFHQLVQKSLSVEQLGLQLQKVAKRAFPTLVGKDLDRLMKGRFFQALLPKWQRKLGAPKMMRVLMSCSIVHILWSVGSNSIMTLQMSVEERTNLGMRLVVVKGVIFTQKRLVKTRVATVVSQLVHLIGRGCSTFSVEHAVNMVTLGVTVDSRGDKVPSLRVDKILGRLLNLRTPCRCVVLQTVVIGN